MTLALQQHDNYVMTAMACLIIVIQRRSESLNTVHRRQQHHTIFNSSNPPEETWSRVSESEIINENAEGESSL